MSNSNSWTTSTTTGRCPSGNSNQRLLWAEQAASRLFIRGSRHKRATKRIRQLQRPAHMCRVRSRSKLLKPNRSIMDQVSLRPSCSGKMSRHHQASNRFSIITRALPVRSSLLLWFSQQTIITTYCNSSRSHRINSRFITTDRIQIWWSSRSLQPRLLLWRSLNKINSNNPMVDRIRLLTRNKS